MYDLGIIGGMGPESTQEFFRRIVAYTDAKCDQEHMSICILNIPSIPDRTKAISEGTSLLPYFRKAINDLVKLNVKRYVIGCNTVHYFLEGLKADDRIEFINMVAETVSYIKACNIQNIAIFGTKGGLIVYKNEFIKAGVVPFQYSEDIKNTVHSIIYDIKQFGAGIEQAKKLHNVINDLHLEKKNIYVLLGCTELSLLKPYLPTDLSVIDALDVMAITTIKKAGYKTKDSIIMPCL